MRLAAGLTQEQLAARMQISQRFVSGCESCERRVDFFELLDWCRATEAPFITFVEEMKISLPAHSTERT